jgi:anion-transporting  ArsA/GET3 family ATPase
MMPTRASLRLASVAVQTFLRTVARVVGSEVIDDVVAFFRAFEGMEEGFRERARAVAAILADPETAFVLVTSPRRDAVEEATFFARRLADHHQHVAALIVNRVHPAFGDEDPEGLRARARDLAALAATDDTGAAARLAVLHENLADFRDVARREREHLRGLQERVGATTVALVPYLARDVYDFAALSEVGRALLDGEEA